MLHGLQKRFVLFLLVLFLAIALLTVWLFDTMSTRLANRLGEEFVTQYAVKEKNRIQGLIDRELALAMKLVDTPILKQWLRHEDDPRLKAMAFEELESFRRAFRDHSYFVAVKQSLHYYANDPAGAFTGQELRYTLDPNRLENRWFFSTMETVESFDLNVDLDTVKDGKIKLWINMVVKDGNDKLGLAGSGLEMTSFLAALLGRLPPGMTLMLFNESGAIHAHPNRALIDDNSLLKTTAEQSTLFRLLDSELERQQVRAAMTQVRHADEGHVHLPITLEGKTTLATLVYLDSINHYMLVASDLNLLVDPQWFTPLILMLIASLVLLLFAVTLLLNRLVLRPLEQLSQSTERIAAGDYALLDGPERRDELGTLQVSFNKMVATVRHYTGNLEAMVTERTQALDLANRELRSSIEYARLLQATILPKAATLSPYIPDHFLLWLPRDRVGGDFYWFHSGSNGCLLGLIDCTGHGVPGALMTMTANAVLNHIASALCDHDPATILRHASRIMRETLQSEGATAGMDNGMDMALCHWQPGARSLTFAGAKGVLLRATEQSVELWRGQSHSLGYRRSNTAFPFANQTVTITPDSAFYMTSDGLLDQSGGEKGFGFGLKRLREALATTVVQPMAYQQQHLLQVLQGYQGNQTQRDDITVIGFRLFPNPFPGV